MSSLYSVVRRGHVEIVVAAVVAVALLGLVGWRAWEAFHKKSDTAATSSVVETDAPAIKNSSDLSTVDHELESLDIDSNDTSDLNAQLTY